MHAATYLAFQDELMKIADVMTDAHADYVKTLKTHMNNPQFVARLHPTERQAVFKHLNSASNAGLGKKMVAKAGNAVASIAKHADAAPDGGQNFKNRKKLKLASNALELAGLATLAAPTVQKMRGKPMSERAGHAAEVGGLGILAAHPAYELGKAGLSKLKAMAPAARKLVHASVKEASDLWNPSTGASVASDMGSRAANRGVSTATQALKRPQFTMAHLQNAYQKSGITPGLKSAVKSLAKHAAPTGPAMMAMHRLADSAKAAIKPGGAVKGAVAAMSKNPLRAENLAKYTATGGHAWDPKKQLARALPLT